jgi:hypothetical protein
VPPPPPPRNKDARSGLFVSLDSVNARTDADQSYDQQEGQWDGEYYEEWDGEEWGEEGSYYEDADDLDDEPDTSAQVSTSPPPTFKAGSVSQTQSSNIVAGTRASFANTPSTITSPAAKQPSPIVTTNNVHPTSPKQGMAPAATPKTAQPGQTKQPIKGKKAASTCRATLHSCPLLANYCYCFAEDSSVVLAQLVRDPLVNAIARPGTNE